MAIGQLLGKLELVRKGGRGRWIARCPAHADKDPSLSVRELGDGRILIHCFAGCDAGDVLTAICSPMSTTAIASAGLAIGKRLRIGETPNKAARQFILPMRWHASPLMRPSLRLWPPMLRAGGPSAKRLSRPSGARRGVSPPR